MFRWRFPTTAVVGSAVFLIGLVIFLYPHMASWFSEVSQARTVEDVIVTQDEVGGKDRVDELDKAEEYNASLSGGAVVDVAGPKPHTTSDEAGSAAGEALDYDDLLNANDAGVMGRLRIPAIGVDLPIYHGTSDETLAKGVGHLRGTSLPVGGTSTRSVLTAHRGLPEATMFNDLGELTVGDRVVLEVFGEVLTYDVVDSRVIDPHDTGTIKVEEGQDLVTLVTCTPLGLNTHRIIVTAERVLPTPAADLQAAGQPSEGPGFPWWAANLGMGVAASAAYILYAGLRRKR